MEIKIKKDAFVKGLQLAQSIADRKSTMPLLANVLLRSEGNQSITCAATDLRISVVAEVPAEVLQEGMISIGAKYLYEIVKNLPDEDIDLKQSENNWAEIRAKNAKYRVMGMSGRDFPKLPETQEVSFSEIDAKTLSDMLGKTAISVSQQETRRHLNGIYVEWSGPVLRMVSTDGHRLTKVEYEVGEGLDISEGIIIPRKGVLELRHMLESVQGTCDIGLLGDNLFVRANDLCLTVKLVDAQFPPYEQVIPSKTDKQAIVSRIHLLDALKRIAIMSSDKTGGVRFEVSPGSLRITSDNPDLGEAQEDLEVSFEGQELSIGFNARYYIELLNEMSTEKVALEFNGELDPGLVRQIGEEGFVGVIMPLRL